MDKKLNDIPEKFVKEIVSPILKPGETALVNENKDYPDYSSVVLKADGILIDIPYDEFMLYHNAIKALNCTPMLARHALGIEEYPVEYASECGDISKARPTVCGDLVNHPAHYTSGGIECIEAIKASMSKEAYQGYLKGNVLKYLWRYEKKANQKQDLEKAATYLKWLIESNT